MPQRNRTLSDLGKNKIILSNNVKIAKVAQLVEHDLAKVGVAGSSPVFRSNNRTRICSEISIEFVLILKNTKQKSSSLFSSTIQSAQMVKLVDTLVSGTSGRKAVQVRVLFWAQNECLS